MGLVTDIYWICPGCRKENKAQVYGEWEDPPEFRINCVPISRQLKWNPPCEQCGLFKLDNHPEIYVPLPIVKVDA